VRSNDLAVLLRELGARPGRELQGERSRTTYANHVSKNCWLERGPCRAAGS